MLYLIFKPFDLKSAPNHATPIYRNHISYMLDSKMEIATGFRIIGLALYLEKHDALVIGDVHLGFEEAMNKEGVLLPRFQYKDTIEHLQKILDAFKGRKISEVIINGDLKHEFGEISGQEWREILKFIDLILEHCSKLVIVKGNHDVILHPIANKRNIEIHNNYFLGDIFITHGHELPTEEEFKKANTILIGNEHPAVSIREGARSETYKCFIRGKWNGKDMIAMPSFNQVTIGSDLLKEKFLSPYFRQDISNFEVYVAGDRTYHFGKLKNLKD